MLHVNEKFTASIPHSLTGFGCKRGPIRVMVNNLDGVSLQPDHRVAQLQFSLADCSV